MGGVASSIGENMQKAMAKNQVAMMDAQKEMGMKQRQAQMAAGIAMGRERFRYQCYFFGILFTVLPIAAIAKKNPALCFPMLPMSFVIAF